MPACWLAALLFALLLAACTGSQQPEASSGPPLFTPVPAAASTPTLAKPAATGPAAATATALPRPTPTPDALPGTAGDPYIPELGNSGYDVVHYTLRFDLDPEVHFVIGHTTIEAVSQLSAFSQMWLDFAGYSVTEVRVDGARAAYSRQGKKLVVEMPAPLPAGRPFTADIFYRGQPPQVASPFIAAAENLGFNYPGNGTVFAFSEPDGARNWFPGNDHPRDKATFRLEITVPSGLTGVGNGTLVDHFPSGNKETFVWEHHFPMATYLAVVAVGDYVRLETLSDNGVPIRSYASPDQASRVQLFDDLNREALAWMSDLFGPYPFESYGYVTVHLPGLSMETQTMVLLSDFMVGEQTMVHEMAHMWFGDWVSLDSWGEMWRNEGMATYISEMWEFRDDPEGLELMMAGIASAVTENGGTAPLLNPPASALFGYNTYFKGALLAHNLRRLVGDEAFFAGLRLYLARYGGGTASQSDFQAVMEEVSGQSLADFFHSWLQ